MRPMLIIVLIGAIFIGCLPKATEDFCSAFAKIFIYIAAKKTKFHRITFFFLVIPILCCTSTPKSTKATQETYHTKSIRFSVNADGEEMYTEAFKDIHYADFTIQAKTSIEIVFNGQLASVSVSPAVKGIQPVVIGNTIRFELTESGWYVLTVRTAESEERLFLFANEPEKNIPKVGDANVISVMDFVTDAIGKTIQTSGLQKAIDAAIKAKKTLLFPCGVYLTGTLTIGSNADIYLADGAMIKGSANREDYPTDDDRLEADHINNSEAYSDNGEFMTFSRLILIDNSENVHIRGRGIIDGSGSLVRSQGKPANLIRIRNSKNVMIEEVILRDPAAWNTHILHCEDVVIRNVKILNDPTVHNTDGFDPDASRRVLIDNCFAYCSDDNIAVKTTNNMNLLQDLDDITIRNCVFLTRKSSLKVGTESKAQRMSNILFENNDVLLCDRGLALYCNDGSTFEEIRFINNRIERNYPDNQRKLVHFQIRDRFGKGQIKNVLIKDVDFLNEFPRGSVIEGLNDEHLIDGLVFDNVTIAGKKANSLEDFGIKTAPFVKNIVFK